MSAKRVLEGMTMVGLDRGGFTDQLTALAVSHHAQGLLWLW